MLCVNIFFAMVTVTKATPVRIRYDQRQDGEYNFAAHIKKVAVIVPSDIKSEVDVSQFDFEDLKALNQQHSGISQQNGAVNQQAQMSQPPNNIKLVSSSRNTVK